MITLYLTRHGQTEENIARIFQGHLPGKLTAEGKRQAADLGERLKNLQLDAIVSSDLQRVIDTVSIALPDTTLPWERTPLLREIDWGSWTGRKIADVDTTNIPADAESKAMLYHRAGRFLETLKQQYRGKTVLVVGHGLINRSIQAHILGVDAEHLCEISHMDNTELRKFQIE